MPRRDDIKKIAILGSGPIRIGQAAEFDFSGSQACRALRDDGYEIIIINSNPHEKEKETNAISKSPKPKNDNNNINMFAICAIVSFWLGPFRLKPFILHSHLLSQFLFYSNQDSIGNHKLDSPTCAVAWTVLRLTLTNPRSPHRYTG